MPEGIDDPKLSAEGELALARVALIEGDLPHAADHVAAALAHAPDLPAVHQALAHVTAPAGGGAVAEHPDHAVLLGVCSALGRKMNRVDWALSWAAQAVAAQPSTMTEMWLGYAQQRAGRVDEAVASLRRAMVHDPMNFSLHADAA